MKKYLFLLLGLFLAAACTDERDFDQIYQIGRAHV